MEKEKEQVRIHIDRKPYESPKSTINSALYVLGGIGVGYELFKEVHGDKEDEPIPKTDDVIHLHEDEHFYSAQTTLNPGAKNNG